jgi:hypothetical protein
MIPVSSKTTKKELLQSLQDTSAESGILYIKLKSLPSFLNTPVAFTIFNYQIGTFPREIVWVSGNASIHETLKSVNTNLITIDEFQKRTGIIIEGVEPKESVVSPQPEEKAPAKPKMNLGGLNKPKLDLQKGPKTSTVISDSGKVIDTSKPLIEIKKKDTKDAVETLDITSKQTTDTEKYTEVFPTKLSSILNSEGVYVHSAKEEKDASGNVFSAETVFESSPLLDTSESSDKTETKTKDEEGKGKQNLDVWLERLSATKEALDSLKMNKSSADEAHQLLKIVPPDKVGSSKVTKNLNNAFFLAGSVAMAILAVGFLVLFPTVAYTVTVRPEVLEENKDIELSVDDFAKRSTKLESTAQTPSSGQQEVPTERSIGQVSLINPGNKDVTLDNGQFRLIANNREYEAVLNTTLARTFRIPARNNLNGPAIEFTVQARQPGPEYNLAEGQRLEIVNLLGQKVCLNCYAITVSNIQNTTLSGETTVTDADHSLLIGSTDSDLARKRVEEIENIQEEDIFTNPNWYQNTGSSYNFSQEVGTLTPEVSLTVEVNTDLYYLPRDILEEKIKQQNEEVDSINQIALIETSGSFGEDDTITMKVFYSYDKKTELDSQDVRNTIKDSDCQEAPKDLQQQYPTIDYVDCRNLGVQIPGVSPRIDVTIVSD